MQSSLVRHDSKAWRVQVWASFAIAIALSAVGLAYLPGEDIDRAFMMMGYGFCLLLPSALAGPLKSALLAVAILGTSASCLAHDGRGASQASALSTLPIAVSVAAPVVLLSAGVILTAVTVQASAQGAVWILESASDGARMSVTVASGLATAASLAVGTVVMVSAIGSGWVLSAAGQAIAFIPNEIGKALLYNERVTR